AYSVPGIDFRATIRNFAGMRANTDRDDFIIRTVKPRFAEAAGIRSPGLSAAPAIAIEIIELLEKEGLILEEKPVWTGTRNKKWINHMTKEQIKQAIEENPLYGRVICRCETVTEGEIVDALHSPIPPVSVDGVKRRTGAGMGRCQGGFCAPRIVEIMARELGVDRLEILKDIGHSSVLTGHTGEVSEDV
ncbi:MAG: (2Fe-2S)-binding protein, partial [Oscillospiraceae bacterium]|nr:(2Fe-2S)-binding protein [Oscillospiraceae bacterium]